MPRRTLRLLLDTSFLLPSLGFRVEKPVLEALSFLRREAKAQLYYLEEGLLEALWAIARHLDKLPFEAVEMGLETIRGDYELLHPSAWAFGEALKIYADGHRDIIDALHYTTALEAGIGWLTIDEQFHRFLEIKGYSTRGVIIRPEDILLK